MPRPFQSADAPKHYPPDRPLEMAHIRLDAELDFPGRAIAATATLTLIARADDVRFVYLDAVSLQLDAITVDGRPATSWYYDGNRIVVTLDAARARGEQLKLAVKYRAQPRRGLYFLAPDADHPERPEQCWTQGQDEDARHYLPCIDSPIEKATSEILCTAPGTKIVLSNGDLVSCEAVEGRRKRWHYRLDVPHASYLLTLVCGEFSESRTRAPETGVDVYTFAPKGREEDTQRALARTPEMIDFFSRRIGVRYPFSRYSQIAVADFIFGGMENTTATTLTDQALLDARAALDHDVESLVSHELAHQWWGDLVTCREWSEAWLNEGFATYFEYLWYEHARGRDEADAHALAQQDAYLEESGDYQRPVVCRQYREPIELFDSHLYEKGARILHMVRTLAKDADFFAALKLYCERHAHGTVETRDLARALETVTGRSWDRFFDDWIGQPGHPELTGSWTWDDEHGRGTLRLDQKQTSTLVYRFALVVRCELGDGEMLDQVFQVEDKSHVFELRLPARPTQVVVDPGNTILKTLKLELPLPLWTRQLSAGANGVDRILAARALAERHEPEAERALFTALASDPFWAVRAEAARALGEHGTARARQALLDALGTRDRQPAKVRRALAEALGKFTADDEAAAALADWVRTGDQSCFVEAAAARALGRTRSPLALELAPILLGRNAFQDVIRARTLEGLGDSTLEAAIDVVLEALRPAASYQVRRAAATALGKLGEGSPRARLVRERLEVALGAEPSFAVRAELASALARLRDPRAIPALERARACELDGRTRRALDGALARLREGQSPPEELRRLREQLESLRGDHNRLRERVDMLEQRAAGRPPTGSRSPSGIPAGPAPAPRDTPRPRTTPPAGTRRRPGRRRTNRRG